MNSVNMMNRQLNNGIYILSQSDSVMYISSKYPRISDVSDIYLWYCRLDQLTRTEKIS